MDITQITPFKVPEGIQEQSNLFLGMLAHYKPEIEQTIDWDIWSVARQHNGLMENLPLVTQEVILTQLTDAIINDAVAKYGDLYKEHRNDESWDLKQSIGEAIEWYVDHDIMTMSIIGSDVTSVDCIESIIQEIIQTETTAG